MPAWKDFYNNYKTAVLGSGLRDETFVAEVQAAIADRVVYQFMDPYEFPSFHERLLGTCTAAPPSPCHRHPGPSCKA